MSGLPAQVARSLTWDRGKEMPAHALFTVETGSPVYFADPRLALATRHENEAVTHALNTRPRKSLGWRTPHQGLQRILTPHTYTTPNP